ncbi:MAG TPA: hypothetical protein VF032_06565, partial [Thermoleophilaceae bacterium]
KLRKATAHVHEPPPALRDVYPAVPKAFEPVVRRALAKERSRRYGSAGELGAAALDAANGRRMPRTAAATGTTRTRRLHTPPPKRRRRRPSLGAITAVLAALAVAGLAAYVLTANRGTSPSHAHRRVVHKPKPPPPPPQPSAAAGTVRCSQNACTQAGHKVQPPIEDGTCANGTGNWARIDASGNPLIVCMAASNPPDGSPPELSTVPNVIHGQLDLVHDYLDGLAIKHDTTGGGIFGIIDNSAYEVCATDPPVGAALPPDGKVQLYAEHSC